MATEIELKARVLDSEALKVLLHEKAEYSCAFEKEDCYWFDTSGLALPRLRLRREKRVFPDGSDESAIFVTYKNKELRGGIEVNDEHEFAVNPGPEFEDFLSKIGFTPGISKRKRGWAFTHDGINAELAEVEGLGWFVELEIVTAGRHAGDINTGDREKAVTAAGKKLLDFLDCLGIERKAIESRFYTEMLKEKGL